MSRRMHASLALLALLGQSPAAFAKTYVVKKGETLSKIAVREYGKPILGPKGSLQKVLQKNPQIQNPNLIYPQQVINLGDEVAAQAPASPVRPSPPAPAPAPAPQEASKPAAASDAASSAGSPTRFGLTMGVGLSKDELEAVDHERSFKTTLDSDNQVTFDLAAYYKPSEATRLGLSLGIKGGDFQDSDDNRFQGESDSLYRISAFGEVTLANRFHLGLEIGTEQSFFFEQTGVASFGLEDVFVDFSTVTAHFDVIAQESWRWSLGAQSSYHAPSDAEGADVRKGSSYAALTRLAYLWRAAYSLEGTLQYGRRDQGIDGIRQNTTERAAHLSLRYEF